MAEEDQTKAEEAAKLEAAVRNARAPWLDDGKGVRGNQPTIPASENSNEQRRSDSPKGEVIRPPQPQTASTTTETATTGDNVDMYGAVNAAPGIFHLVKTAEPSPLEEDE